MHPHSPHIHFPAQCSGDSLKRRELSDTPLYISVNGPQPPSSSSSICYVCFLNLITEYCSLGYRVCRIESAGLRREILKDMDCEGVEMKDCNEQGDASGGTEVKGT